MSEFIKPYCKHSGYRDCFACDPDCKCWLLSDTDFIKGACPFYKNFQDIRREHYAIKDQRRLSKTA